MTTLKEVNKGISEEGKIKRARNGSHVVCPPGVERQTWDDFLAIRKAKRAPMTTTALKGIEREAGKAGLTIQEALALCCERGWQGFRADWIDPRRQGTNRQDNASRYDSIPEIM